VVHLKVSEPALGLHVDRGLLVETVMIEIAVVGYGSAGRSRVRAIAATEGVVLRGIVSRRGAAALDSAADPASIPQTLAWDAVLRDLSIDAVAMCTENVDHAARVREALDAGKHVLCEYPIALSAAEGRALLAHAERAGRVLHEGHIELLADPHVALSAELEARRFAGARVRGVELSFTGRADARTTSLASAGFPSFSGFARLNRLVDLFGSLRVDEVRWHDRGDDGFLLESFFSGGAGARLFWREERGAALARRTDILVSCDDGSVVRGYGDAKPGPVFARDTQRFIAVVRGETAAGNLARERARVEHCLDLADALRARSLRPSP